ncbi:hypothetical protein A2U01_0079629, partial [Trifolium medium]|nr:hypothetical protein [Trifolium medium]
VVILGGVDDFVVFLVLVILGGVDDVIVLVE